jgi:hypothetical protein
MTDEPIRETHLITHKTELDLERHLRWLNQRAETEFRELLEHCRLEFLRRRFTGGPR